MNKVIIPMLIFFFVMSCDSNQQNSNSEEEAMESTQVEKGHPDWSKNANIYEVNIRQYTPEGTIAAFIPHLERLKSLGVDILWLMPIFPIGEEERKGGMGSPYSIQDYTAVNPDFGTINDFKLLMKKAHALGFKVILDWVANHSAFDNQWAKDHPEWYTQDSTGAIIHPADTDWSDVADLNYDNKNMRAAMIDAMKYWVVETDIDGFRCDVAGFVPDDFWTEAIDSLQEHKHLFMLAEWDEPKMHDDGFHMTYGWGFHHIMNDVAKGKQPIAAIDSFLINDATRYKAADYRMNFTTNHDENSWNGTIYERMGDLADAITVLAFTVQGMPLIYGGQEMTLNHRLSFFEKDSINWKGESKEEFFKKLLHLKHENEALWNGDFGGTYKRIETTSDDAIFAYIRTKGSDRVIVMLNLSDQSQSFSLMKVDPKKFTNIFTETEMTCSTDEVINLAPGAYVVLSTM